VAGCGDGRGFASSSGSSPLSWRGSGAAKLDGGICFGARQRRGRKGKEEGRWWQAHVVSGTGREKGASHEGVFRKGTGTPAACYFAGREAVAVGCGGPLPFSISI